MLVENAEGFTTGITSTRASELETRANTEPISGAALVATGAVAALAGTLWALLARDDGPGGAIEPTLSGWSLTVRF